jgi:4-hydroxythreonine-4-phosphate dehydrogenase
MQTEKITIGITMGDPAGIGPEIAVKVFLKFLNNKKIKLILYGSKSILHEAWKRYAGNYDFNLLNIKQTSNLEFSENFIAKTNPECGKAGLQTVINATKDTISSQINAIVTAPLNKASINMAGIPFSGHTELIASMCNCNSFAMMQSADNLRVAFVSTHIPLKDVSKQITQERIIKVTQMLNNAILQEGINSPYIAIAAINPHAGENGYMGNDEITTVIPAIKQLQKNGIKVDGPFPPDTLFIKSTREQYDGIISMYHDQGHIPFKMLAFDKGVNSTLGLPIIRTSVDHGTAFNIAWQGIANTGSLTAAVNLAIKRAQKYNNN